MKKIWLNIYLFIRNFFFSMKAGNEEIFGKNSDSNKNINNSEVEQETDSVYSDLLNEQVTERVKELRHEMYFAEREAKKYKYLGGGVGIKNELFEYKGNIERSDGFPVQIVQRNIEDTDGLAQNLSEHDYGNKNQHNYTISIERDDFIPQFKIEEYTSQIVVKKANDNKVVFDLYTTKYESQFNRRHKPFLNELGRIYEGDIKSDVIDFDKLSFVAYNAYGSDDLKLYSYINIEFITIIDYDGYYVLRFSADIELDGYDLIQEFYHEETAKKCENHEPREKATYDLSLNIK